MRSLLLALLASCLLVRAHAQSQSDPVTVPVDIVAEFHTDVPPAQWEGGWFSVSGASLYHQVQYPGLFILENRVDLKPGMAYHFNVSNYRIQNWSLRVHPPTGYSVYIENVERERFNGTGDKLVKVRIAATAGLAAGDASEPRPGRVLWSVGLGQLKNGDAAGEIQMRESAITADCFRPSSLYYDSDNPDVRVVTAAGVLRQVYANECLADIVAINSISYRIAFWSRTAVIYGQNVDGTWRVPLAAPDGSWRHPLDYNQVVAPPFVAYVVENPVHPTLDRIKITRTDAINGTRTSWTQIRKSGSTWTVLPWNTGTYPATPDSQSTISYSNSDRNELVSTKDVAGTTVAQTLVEYKDFAWGRELWRTTVGSGQANALVSTLDYHATASAKGNYRQVKSRTGPDGSWECFEYYDDIDRRGQLKRSFRPFMDSPATAPSTPNADCVVTDIDYAADFTGQRILPSSIVTSKAGVTLSRTQIAYNSTAETRNGLPIVVATRDDFSSASASLRTITRTYRADSVAYPGVHNAAFFAGKPQSVVRPDGTMQAYVYQWGVFNPSNRAFIPVSGATEFRVTIIDGTTTASGNTACSQWGDHAIDGAGAPAFHLIPGRSTASSTVYAASGLPIYTSQMVFTSSGWQGVSGRLTAYVQGLAAYPSWTLADAGYAYTNMEVFSADYNEGNLLSWSKDASGIERFYMHDSLGRRYGEVISRIAGQPIVTGQPHDETWSLQRFDAAGRVVQSWTANAFNYPNPASADILSTAAYDYAGRVTSQTTRGVVGETISDYTTSYTYFYGGDPRTTRVVGPDGADVITTNYRDGRPRSITGSGTAPRYLSYSVSGDGRLVSESKLNTTNNDGWTQTYSDWLGRDSEVLRSTFSGGHTKFRNLYDGQGRLTESQLFNQSWQALLAPTRYRYDANGRLDRSGMDVNQNGLLDDTGLDRVTLSGATFVPLDGAWWAESSSKTLTNVANATDGVFTTTRTRLTGLYSVQPDGSSLIGETRASDANGQVTTTMTFVDRGARKTIVKTTVPGSTITGVSTSINGLVASTTSTTGATTQQTYDGHRRPVRTTTRDTVYLELEYYPGTALVKHRKNRLQEFGVPAANFHQIYYDSAGRVSVERVYDSAKWKTSRFAYTTRGELWRQWGSGQNPVEYEYNSYGWRTKMRAYRTTGVNWDSTTWPGVGQPFDETVWTYQGTTGLVTAKTDPKGATVSFTFNDRGQPATRTWARGVVTNYLYEDSSAYQTGDLWQVTYSDGTPSIGYSRNLSGSYTMRHGLPEAIFDGSGGRILWYRHNDLQVTHEYLDQGFYGNFGGQYRTLVRSYDTLGRLQAYDTRWSGSSTANFQSVAYRFDSVTGRVDRVTGTRVGVSTRTLDYQYRANSDLVSAVIGADAGSGFRRDIHHQGWRELVDTVVTTWSGVDRARFTHDYDWSAKRVGQRINGDLAVALGYGAGIQNTFSFTARGEVDWATATRTDNGATLWDRYRDWSYDSQGNRDDETNQSGLKDFEPAAANQYRSIAGILRGYDADGNLTSDGVWWYYWDAENRLKAAQKQDWSKRLEFVYDHQGRRVRKVVKNGDINSPIASDRRYIYDGWNIIAELDGATMQVVKTFTWGLDITGTVHGGGGVGGLLAIHGASETLLPLYDANGNVHGLIDGYSGAMKAAYAYSAFGETLHAVNLNGGTAATDNPIRFASKWLDVESGLYDYNHRVYSPTEGRFISRDPIAENGGLNLYAYCGNDPIGHYDYLGMFIGKWFKKIGRVVSKFWRQFRHTVISAVLYAIPAAGPMLSLAYNASIGARYGGARGMLTALASGGALGGTLQTIARYEGLYRQFSRGKFLNNLGNWALTSVVQSTAYNVGRAVFSGGAPATRGSKFQPDDGDADTTELTEITDLREARKGSYAVLAKWDRSIQKFRHYYTNTIATRNVFINGIKHDLDSHIRQAFVHLGIGESEGEPALKQFTVVHNQSHSAISDILEAGLDIFGISSKPARLTARLMAGAESRGLQVNWVAHSQGGAILAQAMQINALWGRSLSRQTVTFHAAAANSFFTDAVITGTGARGGQHLFNSGDLVPTITGRNGDFGQVLYSVFVPAVGAYGDRHGNPASSWHQWRPGP